MTSILTTVDGSPESLAVLPVLEKLATELKGSIRLLTVVERAHGTSRATAAREGRVESSYAVPGSPSPAVFEPPFESEWSENDDQAIQRVVAEGRDFLDSISQPLRARGFDVHVDAVINNHVAEAIISYAREHNVDFIAMSTHGRSGLRDLVQGSVASAVIKSGVAPVVLVRPSKAEVERIAAERSKAV